MIQKSKHIIAYVVKNYKSGLIFILSKNGMMRRELKTKKKYIKEWKNLTKILILNSGPYTMIFSETRKSLKNFEMKYCRCVKKCARKQDKTNGFYKLMSQQFSTFIVEPFGTWCTAVMIVFFCTSLRLRKSKIKNKIVLHPGDSKGAKIWKTLYYNKKKKRKILLQRQKIGKNIWNASGTTQLSSPIDFERLLCRKMA